MQRLYTHDGCQVTGLIDSYDKEELVEAHSRYVIAHTLRKTGACSAAGAVSPHMRCACIAT